jgi:hypothetical protein
MACGGGGGGRGGTGWSSLPADLLLAVFALLPSDADRSRFRAVCAAWAAAASAWRPGPWLVGSRTDRAGRGGGAVSSFWLSPTPGAGLLPFAANVPAGLEYLSSSRGYLALSDPTASPKVIVLVNPVTGRRIRLPPIGFFKRWLDVTTVVLSADPAAAAEWAAVAVGFPTTCLAYYSSATGVWARLDFSAQGYVGVEHYNERAISDGVPHHHHFFTGRPPGGQHRHRGLVRVPHAGGSKWPLLVGDDAPWRAPAATAQGIRSVPHIHHAPVLRVAKQDDSVAYALAVMKVQPDESDDAGRHSDGEPAWSSSSSSLPYRPGEPKSPRVALRE